ncbi:MAG: LysR family transcriptional regulator [Betaproteobacteria bacterium]
MPEKIKEARIVFLFEAIQRGSMRAAADALGIAPSAVSRQIALLEQELAIPLIERHARGVKPTEAGQLLIEYFREQRSHQNDLLSHLQELRGLRSGTVRVALGEGFVSDFMAGPLRRFSKDYSNVSIVLDVGGTNELIRRVCEDEADIGVVFNPPQGNKIVSVTCSKQPVQAIVGPGFPLLREAGPFKITDFLCYPLALNHPTYGMRHVLQLVEEIEKIRMTPNLTTNSFYILRQFAKLQLGVTFLPSFVAADELEAGELFAIPVRQSIMENAEVHLIKRPGRRLSFAATRMMQYMASGMRSLKN